MRFFVFCYLLYGSLLFGCTDFVLQTEDGAWINGRSMEFGLDLQSKLVAVPRNQKVLSQAPDRKRGIEWTSKYGFVGATALGKNNLFVQGLNERGLSFGALWLPGTQYPPVQPNENGNALDFVDFGAWVLGTFSTVAEVKQALKTVRIWGHSVPPLPGIPPMHAAIHDAQGNNLVVEFWKAEMKIYDNPNGVLTNYPPFDWHTINMQNYVNLNALNAPSVNWKKGVLAPSGQGSGFLGLPGDWTPPSRFVRASIFLHFAQTPKEAKSGVNLANHILNTVDIPKGDIREKEKDTGDYTQWVMIQDLTNKVVYFRSYDDLCLKMIDLKKLKLESGTPSQPLPITTAREPIDMTPSFQSRESITAQN